MHILATADGLAEAAMNILVINSRLAEATMGILAKKHRLWAAAMVIFAADCGLGGVVSAPPMTHSKRIAT